MSAPALPIHTATHEVMNRRSALEPGDQAANGVGCPTGMSYAASPIDAARSAAERKIGSAIGMTFTEKHGGSDFRFDKLMRGLEAPLCDPVKRDRRSSSARVAHATADAAP